MSSKVFKSTLLHGALAVIGLIAGTFGSHAVRTDGDESEIERSREQGLQSNVVEEVLSFPASANTAEYADLVMGHSS